MVQISDNKCTIVNSNPFSSILSWRIPCTEEPVRLQAMGWQSVGEDWATILLVLLWVLLSQTNCFPDGSVGEESAWDAGDTGDVGLIPGSARSSGEGNGDPLQYTWLKNTMDREAWQTTVQRVVKSRAWLSD